MRRMADAGARPGGITALSLFFLAGALISLLAGVSLATPGGFLEPIWQLNPQARQEFAGIGRWAVALMAVVCLACVTTARGLWYGRPWGYWLAFGGLSINMVADAANALLRNKPEALIGVPIVLALLAFLRSGRVRRFFERGG